MEKVKVLCLLLLVLCKSSLIFAQTVEMEPHRLITRSTLYGVGATNILDTYLSPMEYKGMEFRVARESNRMTTLFDGNVSSHSFLQANLSYTHNDAETSNSISGLINWNYGLRYRFRINERLEFQAGALGDFNLGFIYNLRNSNNPANAKAYINLTASGAATYQFKIKNYPMTVHYQANLPMVGLMFSPNFQQSYYEIFTVGNRENTLRFTSLHNQPSLRQMLSIDFPIRNTKLRISYIGDLQQWEVNRIKAHTYSHLFMIGFVKTLYKVKANR